MPLAEFIEETIKVLGNDAEERQNHKPSAD